MKKIVICDQCQTLNRVELQGVKSKKPVCGKCAKEIESIPSMMYISGEQIEKMIRNASLPVVVDAYADWCGPCKMYGPIFQQASKELWEKAEFVKLDTERNPEFSARYGIRGIPATLVFFQGKLVKQQSGLLQKEHLIQLVGQFTN